MRTLRFVDARLLSFSSFCSLCLKVIFIPVLPVLITSVCACVGHIGEPCRNGWADQVVTGKLTGPPTVLVDCQFPDCWLVHELGVCKLVDPWVVQGAFWGVDLGGPRKPFVRCGCRSAHAKWQFWGFPAQEKALLFVKHRMSACLSVLQSLSRQKWLLTHMVPSNHVLHGGHTDATWQIQWIDLCGGCDAALCYHYCSHLYELRVGCVTGVRWERSRMAANVDTAAQLRFMATVRRQSAPPRCHPFVIVLQVCVHVQNHLYVLTSLIHLLKFVAADYTFRPAWFQFA